MLFSSKDLIKFLTSPPLVGFMGFYRVLAKPPFRGQGGFLTILLFVYSLHLNAQTEKFVYTRGQEILTPEGKPFLMKGTNLGNWLVPEGYMFKFRNASSPRKINEVFEELLGPEETKKFWKKYLDNYITADDIHYLKSIGMNSIRLPFNYRMFTTEHYMGGSNDKRGFIFIDRLVNWCKKEKLYLLLDMHCAPGGQTGDNIDDSYGYPFLFESNESQQLTVDIWKRIAERYKNEEIIMGYDLLNEPIAHYFDTDSMNPKLEPLYKRIVKAIRQVDKNHLVFIGGAQWNSNFRPFGPPFDDKLVYEFHKYWTETTQNVIQEYIDFRDKHNVPVYVGETGENTDEWVMAFRKLVEKNNIGWHFWPYKKMENKKGIVEFAKPPAYDTIIKYADTSKMNFEDIRKARPKNIGLVKKAMDDFLTNCRFENCSPNEGYIVALGLLNVRINKRK